MWRIAAAVLAAAFMLLITELAYQSQSEQLSTLAKMGKARLTLTYAMQRVTDAESGKRGYLLVGGQDYLEPYVRASNDVRVALREIHALDHASGEASLPNMQLKLDQLFDEKLAEMQEVLRRHDSGNREAAIDMVRSGIGREIMQRMRDEFDVNMAHRNRLVTQGLDDIQELLLLGRIGIAAMTVLSLLILILLIRQGRQLMIEREAQRTSLLHEKDRLEQEVQRRTSDLRDLARHLRKAGHRVRYVAIDDASNRQSIPDNLAALMAHYGAQTLQYQHPDEWRLDEQLRTWGAEQTFAVQAVSSEHFYTTRTEMAEVFQGRKQWLMEHFYRRMRQRQPALDP